MQRIRRRLKIAFLGVVRVLRRPKYLFLALAISIVFVFIFNLLASGNTYLQLLINLPWLDKPWVIGAVYVNFLADIFSLDKILMLLLSLLQGVLVSLIVFSARHSAKIDDRSVLGGGLTALIGLLGAGCPLCGGSLLIALLAVVFGAGAYLWLQTISTIIVILAFIPVLFALRRQGFLCYTLANINGNRGGENEQKH